MALQEYQPEIIDTCNCGAILWDGDDLRYPLWAGGDPDCPHEISNPEKEADYDRKTKEI